MLQTQLPRLAALGLCLALLFGLLVLGGTGWPADPEAEPGIASAAAAEAPAEHAGEYVDTAGLVVETDPTVIAIGDADDPIGELEVENVHDVEVGEILMVDGTLTEEGTLDANPDRARTREPWAATYRNLISIVGALLVAAAGVDSWRLNARTLSVEPRERPLHEALLERATEEGSTDG